MIISSHPDAIWGVIRAVHFRILFQPACYSLEELFLEGIGNMEAPSEYHLFQLSCQFLLIAAVSTFILLVFVVDAPYGKQHQTKWYWGFNINNRLCWFLMELPSVVVFFIFFLMGDNQIRSSWYGYLLLLCWETHYIHRALIFPFRIRYQASYYYYYY